MTVLAVACVATVSAQIGYGTYEQPLPTAPFQPIEQQNIEEVPQIEQKKVEEAPSIEQQTIEAAAPTIDYVSSINYEQLQPISTPCSSLESSLIPIPVSTLPITGYAQPTVIAQDYGDNPQPPYPQDFGQGDYLQDLGSYPQSGYTQAFEYKEQPTYTPMPAPYQTPSPEYVNPYPQPSYPNDLDSYPQNPYPDVAPYGPETVYSQEVGIYETPAPYSTVLPEAKEYPALPEATEVPILPGATDYPALPALPEATENPILPVATDYPALPEATGYPTPHSRKCRRKKCKHGRCKQKGNYNSGIEIPQSTNAPYESLLPIPASGYENPTETLLPTPAGKDSPEYTETPSVLSMPRGSNEGILATGTHRSKKCCRKKCKHKKIFNRKKKHGKNGPFEKEEPPYSESIPDLGAEIGGNPKEDLLPILAGTPTERTYGAGVYHESTTLLATPFDAPTGAPHPEGTLIESCTENRDATSLLPKIQPAPGAVTNEDSAPYNYDEEQPIDSSLNSETDYPPDDNQSEEQSHNMYAESESLDVISTSVKNFNGLMSPTFFATVVLLIFQ